MCLLRPPPQKHLGPQVVALVPEVPAPWSPLWGRPRRGGIKVFGWCMPPPLPWDPCPVAMGPSC